MICNRRQGEMSEEIKFMGNRLKERRTQLNFSLERLADLCDTSKSYIHELEKSSSEPSGMLVFKISRATGRPMEWFYGCDEANDAWATRIGLTVINAIKELDDSHNPFQDYT